MQTIKKEYIVDIQSFKVEADNEEDAEKEAILYLKETIPAQIGLGDTVGLIEAIWRVGEEVIRKTI